MSTRRSIGRGRAFAAIVIGAALLVRAALVAGAEQRMPSQAGMQQLVENRQKIVLQTLQLEPQQQAAFEPVFKAYEDERIALGKERNGLVDDFTHATLALSTSDANALLERFFRLRRQRIELDERYRPRFEAVLPPQKVLLLLQLNFILDAVVNYDLAGMIPLAH
jgi:hypothetical protein